MSNLGFSLGALRCGREKLVAARVDVELAATCLTGNLAKDASGIADEISIAIAFLDRLCGQVKADWEKEVDPPRIAVDVKCPTCSATAAADQLRWVSHLARWCDLPGALRPPDPRHLAQRNRQLRPGACLERLVTGLAIACLIVAVFILIVPAPVLDCLLALDRRLIRAIRVWLTGRRR